MVKIFLTHALASALMLSSCTGESLNDKGNGLVPENPLDNGALYGQWFKPHEASIVNIRFDKDSLFKMHDYEERDGEVVFLEREGTYSVEQDRIKLMCVDGEEQTLECIKMDGKIYLRRDSVMMIKGLLN